MAFVLTHLSDFECNFLFNNRQSESFHLGRLGILLGRFQQAQLLGQKISAVAKKSDIDCREQEI